MAKGIDEVVVVGLDGAPHDPAAQVAGHSVEELDAEIAAVKADVARLKAYLRDLPVRGHHAEELE